MVRCDRCGAELRLGDFPFCKRGPEDHVPSQTSVIGDDIPGGVLIEHGLCDPGGVPRRYYSKSEIAREAEKRGLMNYVVHVPRRGSDKSKHTQRWV